jgi:hypothetical protein
VDSNHGLRIQSPAFYPLNHGSSAPPRRGARARATLREKGSNLQPPGSEPGVLPIELSLTEIGLTGRRLESNQQPEAYEASALPLSYAPEFRLHTARAASWNRTSDFRFTRTALCLLSYCGTRPARCSERGSNPHTRFGRPALSRLSYHCEVSRHTTHCAGRESNPALSHGKAAFCQ